jgi:hypothetical protein
LKVAFLIAIYDSFGEREHALSFAAQLRPAGIETEFVVTPPAAEHLRARGVRPRCYTAPEEAMRALDDVQPDWLIACEQFNLPAPLQHAVMGSRFRLATMDGTGMGPTINANPFARADMPPPAALDPRMIRLRPCPVNAPLLPRDGVYSWSLFPGLRRHDGTAARRRWGIAGETRVAMLALAPWAIAAAARLGRGAHYPALLRALVAALATTQQPVELVVISHQAQPTQVHQRVTVRFLPYLAPDVYEELLLDSDLVLSDNVIQTSLSKAFAAGIPTLVVVDSRPEAPPWNMFPLGLRFPEDSPYYRALAPVELADADALRARVAAALAGTMADDFGYRQALATLPTPIDILSSAP